MKAMGINIGHGHTKAVVIEPTREWAMPAFPSQVAAASASDYGIANAPVVVLDERAYWYGDGAELGNVVTLFDQARLDSPFFIPVLAAATMQELRITEDLIAFSCLPAAWTAKSETLSKRLREGAGNIIRLGIIAEPVAAAYSVLLGVDGEMVGDERLRGRIGVVDIGSGTVDACVLHNLQVEPGSEKTVRKGIVHALTAVQSMVGSAYDRDISLNQADTAVRRRGVLVAGREQPLPAEWERVFHALAGNIVTFLDSLWGGGKHLDAVLIAGGGGEEPLLAEAIQRKYPQAMVVPEPQNAIARGCARRARMLMGQLAAQQRVA